MSTLYVTNNFQLAGVLGDTMTGHQGNEDTAFATAYALAVDGKSKYTPGVLATAAVATLWDEDVDVLATFDYLFLVADQAGYVQLIGQAANVILPVAVGLPLVLTGSTMLAAGNTTAIAGGTQPTLTAIDSVVLGNYSGTTMNYLFAVIT